MSRASPISSSRLGLVPCSWDRPPFSSDRSLSGRPDGRASSPSWPGDSPSSSPASASRMALPSIALLAVFSFATFLALGSVLRAPAPEHPWSRLGWLGVLFRSNREPLPTALAGVGTAMLAAVHYWRFRVPITVAAGVAALAVTRRDAPCRGRSPSSRPGISIPILLAVGLCVFVARDAVRPVRPAAGLAADRHRVLAAPSRLAAHRAFGLPGDRCRPWTGRARHRLRHHRGLPGPGARRVLVDRRALLVSGLDLCGLWR